MYMYMYLVFFCCSYLPGLNVTVLVCIPVGLLGFVSNSLLPFLFSFPISSPSSSSTIPYKIKSTCIKIMEL